MRSKIALGTANFAQPYGILSQGVSVPPQEVEGILTCAVNDGIALLDTALGYGDVMAHIAPSLRAHFECVTKVSVLEDFDTLRDQLGCYEGTRLHGLLVHDPHHLKEVPAQRVHDTLRRLQDHYHIEKIGVSAYTLQDVALFEKVCLPHLIQIPLNPFNQIFLDSDFATWAKEHRIEVHARSLFLQGVLLANELPTTLLDLGASWEALVETLAPYPSRMHGILRWAQDQDWITKWVLGVCHTDNLENIFEVCDALDGLPVPVFAPAKSSLVDPRNWTLT